jgi:CRISPR/Cas system CMR-associated protein Cmr1 (group 7 of RAMP superfamily)
MAEEEPVRLVLTEEQREMVRRLSGQHVEAIELEPDDAKSSQGVLRFFWRLSAATGIPRRAWALDEAEGKGQGDAAPKGDAT